MQIWTLGRIRRNRVEACDQWDKNDCTSRSHGESLGFEYLIEYTHSLGRKITRDGKHYIHLADIRTSSGMPNEANLVTAFVITIATYGRWSLVMSYHRETLRLKLLKLWGPLIQMFGHFVSFDRPTSCLIDCETYTRRGRWAVSITGYTWSQ